MVATYIYEYIPAGRWPTMSATFTREGPEAVLKEYDLSSLTVLVAEHNSFLRRTIKSILRTLKVGYIVDAGPIEDAWQAFQSNSPDIVIIDWSPSYDGLQLLWRIRQDPESHNVFVPVIIATSMTEYNNVMAARDKGTTDFLAKPYSPKTIYQHLSKLVEMKKSFVRTRDFFGPDRRARTVQTDRERRRKTA